MVNNITTRHEVKRDRTEYNKKYYREHKDRIKEKHNEWVAKNKERIKEYQREYGKTHTQKTDKIRKRKREWAKKNRQKDPERKREYLREWRDKNKDKNIEYQRKRYKEHRDELIKEWGRYYAGNRILYWSNGSIDNHRHNGYIVNMDRKELRETARNTKVCMYCGEPLGWNNKKITRNSPTLERINNEKEMSYVWKPGEEIRQGAVAIVCFKCNTSKGGFTLEEWVNNCKKITERLGGMLNTTT